MCPPELPASAETLARKRRHQPSRPRNQVSAATLKTRIAKQLARLAKLSPGSGSLASPRLVSWPGWIDELASNLVLLRPLDPMEALSGLRALDHRVTMLDSCHEGFAEEIEPTLDSQERARALQPDFHLALAQADRSALIDQVFILLTEPGLLDQDDGFPQPLLDALGRDGRDSVVSRLIKVGDPENRESSGLGRSCDWSWSVTELLLADPDVDHALGEIDHFGLVDQVCPASVVRFLLRHKAFDRDFMAWMRRAISAVRVPRDGEQEEEGEESLWRPDWEGIAVCESEGLVGLAQEIRHASFEILLDVAQLHDWLERLPESRRPREKARALRHVCADPRRSQALLVLLGWPDLEAAARLVMEHHHEMVGQSCTTFNEAAGQLEGSAPVAAMLLYRRGASNQFSDTTAWCDSRPQLERCAWLWALHPDSACISHEEFLGQLESEKQERRSLWS